MTKKHTTIFNTALPSKDDVQSWARQLIEIEGNIKVLNDEKAAVYKQVKAKHNGAVKDGLQTAVKLKRMEVSRRLHAESASEYAMTFLAMIEDTGAVTPQASNSNVAGPGKPTHAGNLVTAENLAADELSGLQRSRPVAQSETDTVCGEDLGEDVSHDPVADEIPEEIVGEFDPFSDQPTETIEEDTSDRQDQSMTAHGPEPVHDDSETVEDMLSDLELTDEERRPMNYIVDDAA